MSSPLEKLFKSIETEMRTLRRSLVNSTAEDEETSEQRFLRVRALVLNEVEDMEWLEAARLLASAMNELAAPYSHSFCVTIRPLISPESSCKNQ